MALLLGAPVCAQSSLSLWVGRGAAFPVMPVRAPLAYTTVQADTIMQDATVVVWVWACRRFQHLSGSFSLPHSNTKASRRVHARTHRRATVAFCPSFTFESHCITIAGRRVHTRARTCTYPHRSPTPPSTQVKEVLHTRLVYTPCIALPHSASRRSRPLSFSYSPYFLCVLVLFPLALALYLANENTITNAHAGDSSLSCPLPHETRFPLLPRKTGTHSRVFPEQNIQKKKTYIYSKTCQRYCRLLLLPPCM